MRLLSLNIWMGIVHEPLMSFVKEHKDSTDIFCFQEVTNGGEKESAQMWKDTENIKDHRLLEHLQEILPGHTSFFRPHLRNWAGLAMFVRSDIEIVREGELFVHGTKPTTLEENAARINSRNLQYVDLTLNNKPITIINFHGLHTGSGKDDTPSRLAQSRKIVHFLRTLRQAHILCGDFNLNPNTESIKILEDSGLRNLIKKHNIPSTRTSFYSGTNPFADYVFVSDGILVNEFKVLPEEVSDHAALYLDFKMS